MHCFCSFINIAHLFVGSQIKFLDFAKSALNINAVSRAGTAQIIADCFVSFLAFCSTFELLFPHRKIKLLHKQNVVFFILINVRPNMIRRVKLQTGLWNCFISLFLYCEIWYIIHESPTIAPSHAYYVFLWTLRHNHSTYKYILSLFASV